MQIEHVTNDEKISVIRTNYWKNGMKSQRNKKRKQKCTENTASDGITTREFSPIETYLYKIHQYFLQPITKAIQPLAQRPCTNCRELSKFYTGNFMFFLKTSNERLQQSFFPLLCIQLNWKILCVKPIQKYLLNKLQSFFFFFFFFLQHFFILFRVISNRKNLFYKL